MATCNCGRPATHLAVVTDYRGQRYEQYFCEQHRAQETRTGRLVYALPIGPGDAREEVNPPNRDDATSSTVERGEEPLEGCSGQTGWQAATEGMARIESATDEAWSQRAYATVERLAAERSNFTADEVWLALGVMDRPHDGRALGPILRKARLAGLIEPLDLAHSERPERHSGYVQVWSSRVWR